MQFVVSPIPRRLIARAMRFGCLLAAMVVGTAAWAQRGEGICGPLRAAHFGPFDYRYVKGEELSLVEGAHFLPQTEALIRGKREGSSVGGELTYVLRAFPNHHRALVAVMLFGEKFRTDKPPFLMYPIECWFDRAIRFVPDDVMVRMLYANYLIRNKREADTKEHLEFVEKKAGTDAFTHYNLGMLYFDMKKYDKAVEHARVAYDQGLNKPELREALKKEGKWVDVTAPSADAKTAAGATAAAAADPATTGMATRSTSQ